MSKMIGRKARSIMWMRVVPTSATKRAGNRQVKRAEARVWVREARA